MTIRKTTLSLSIVALAMALTAGVTIASQMAGIGRDDTATRFNRDDPVLVDEDNLDIEKPAEWPVYELYDVYENIFQEPGDPEQRRAVNINTLGEVPDSSWFANRLGVRDMTIDEIVTGPNLSGGPAEGQWTVIGRPGGGVTPKFMIEDTAGQRFIIKFDPVDYPEIASGAEMISSKLFYAFGFHVAEAYIVSLTKDRLVIGEDASFRTDTGERRRIDQIDIDYWMSNAPVGPDGRYRALASKFVPGEPVGEFRFFGTRPDDANDVFPHEHRRELRGYRLMASWVNHDDSRALNTYDAYIEENGRRFIKHYLLDFGSTLGSASIGANEPRGGNEYFIEGGLAWKEGLSLGLWHRPWLSAEYPGLPAVGNYEAQYFVPQNWKPEYPNAAFQHLDAADAFWAARILSRFSDEAIAGVVAEARFSDPRATAYVTEVLRIRRDKAVDYWITRSNPLDDFELSGSANALTLSWQNAALRVGAASGPVSYGVEWLAFDNRSGEGAGLSESTTSEPSSRVPAAWGPEDAFGYRYLRIRVVSIHPDFPWWQLPVIVTVRDKGAGGIDIVGISRPRELPAPE